MPTVKLELGNYVTTRPRADGSHRVYFQVPARLAPSGWPSLIPLPIKGERKGNLRDAKEVARIQADAKVLLDRLYAQRLGRTPAQVAGRSVEDLIDAWKNSSAWKGLKPRSWKHYGSYINHIRAWADSTDPRQPDPTEITRADVEDMLALFDGQPVTKKHVRKTMRLIMDQAIALGWRTDNPLDGIRLKRGRRSKFAVWEQADVDAYVEAAEDIGKRSIALMVLMEFEIGQRLGDARAFRPGAEYDRKAGAFRFWQEKTGSWVTIRISAKLKALLNEAADGALFLFRDETTGNAYTEERLSRMFAVVREEAVRDGARPLEMRWLRHSCVVQLARASCEIPEIAAVTGHAIGSVAAILDVYLPRDNKVAENAQRKRGIIP